MFLHQTEYVEIVLDIGHSHLGEDGDVYHDLKIYCISRDAVCDGQTAYTKRRRKANG
ncbi:MAG: hypothetical protein LBI42_00680 [Chitinispirillales bacterium]|nr:hypothetical protein [Chitinispirillales bacterium]